MIKLTFKKSFSNQKNSFELSINTTIERGSFTCLFGVSGSGKTTVLRVLSGLLKPDNGNIQVRNQFWYNSEKNINLPPQIRKIGYIFQDCSLFPNMTVLENIQFANGSKIMEAELIQIMELKNLLYHKPHQLSGGQQQRVALARTMVQKPELLLLDEPLSALDFATRNRLQDYLKIIHKRYNLTIVMISHDIKEVLKLGDRVIELENGKIIRDGSPHELFMKTGEVQVGEILLINSDEEFILVKLMDGIIKVPFPNKAEDPFVSKNVD